MTIIGPLTIWLDLATLRREPASGWAIMGWCAYVVLPQMTA